MKTCSSLPVIIYLSFYSYHYFRIITHSIMSNFVAYIYIASYVLLVRNQLWKSRIRPTELSQLSAI